MRRGIFSLFFFLLLSGPVIHAQVITLVRSVWDDRFTEWEILNEDTGEEGSINLRWTFPLDWSVWDIRWGDTTAEFSLSWKDDPEQWDLIMGGTRVTARTRWPGDLREWRIQFDGETLYWKPLDRFQPDIWEPENLKRVPFRMYTLYEGDPRDWIIEDDLRKDAFPLRLMLIMLAIHHTIPKN